MSDHAAGLLALAIMLNGCLQIPNRLSLNEFNIIDEREISEGLAEAACLIDGRNWEFGGCSEATP